MWIRIIALVFLVLSIIATVDTYKYGMFLDFVTFIVADLICLLIVIYPRSDA